MRKSALIAQLKKILTDPALVHTTKNIYLKRLHENEEREFAALLISYEADKQSEAEATSDNLSMLIKLLKRHSELPGGYLDLYESRMNVIFRRTAFWLQHATKQNMLSYMMPTLQIVSSQDTTELQLNEYVFSDDQSRLIHVYHYLEKAHQSPDGAVDSLSASEIKRIEAHCLASGNIYRNILEAKKKGESYAMPSRDAWQKMLKAPGGVKEHFTADDRAVLRNMAHPQLETQEQLIEALMSYPAQEREQFLVDLSLDELTAKLLEGKLFKAALSEQSAYSGSEERAATVLFAFLSHYRKGLETRGAKNITHNSTSGWLFGKPDMLQKAGASGVIDEFLLDVMMGKKIQKDPTTQIEKVIALEDLDWVLALPENEKHQASFTDRNSLLKAIVEQIRLASHPAYRNPPVQQPGWRLLPAWS